MVKKNLEKLVNLGEKKLISEKPRYEKPSLNKNINISFLIKGQPGGGDSDQIFFPGS